MKGNTPWREGRGWDIVITMKPIQHDTITLRSLFILVALISAMIVSGCNTMRGVGEDTESVGESIQDAAR